MARDQALVAEATRQAELAKELFDKHVGTEDVVKAKQATVATLSAQVAVSSSLVDIAKIQEGYCEIKAPFAGRISDLRIRRGSVITASSGVFTTLAQTKPVHVVFALPQSRLSELRAEMAKRPLAVTAVPRDQAKAPPATGTLAFVDNVVNDASGTIRLKAAFPNADEALWPGQYVTVGLILRDEPQALVVPGAAVQSGQQGTYVFVVKPDGTVALRPVGVARQAGTLTVIAEGVKPGETVVIDGQARLMPGAAVTVLKGNEKVKSENAAGTANKRE
jgi:multidrug efflux system membrane fusion protein